MASRKIRSHLGNLHRTAQDCKTSSTCRIRRKKIRRKENRRSRPTACACTMASSSTGHGRKTRIRMAFRKNRRSLVCNPRARSLHPRIGYRRTAPARTNPLSAWACTSRTRSLARRVRILLPRSCLRTSAGACTLPHSCLRTSSGACTPPRNCLHMSSEACTPRSCLRMSSGACTSPHSCLRTSSWACTPPRSCLHTSSGACRTSWST